jgi:hypothetical protein
VNHTDAWDLIPWVVNGRATAEQGARFERHAEQCADCRAELHAQRALMQAMQTRPAVASMPHASLQKLWTRIDGEPAPQSFPTSVPRRWPGQSGWLAAAVVVQTVLLGVLSIVLLNSRDAATDQGTYRTVSSPAATADAPAVRAVFAPDTRLGELQALLDRAHLHIVNGPTAEGVLTLALASPADDAAQALAMLRADAHARFVEPIGR